MGLTIHPNKNASVFDTQKTKTPRGHLTPQLQEVLKVSGLLESGLWTVLLVDGAEIWLTSSLRFQPPLKQWVLI